MKMISVFLGVFAAIAVAVYVFAPERMPWGLGQKPLPLTVSTRPSLFGQGRVAILENSSEKTLNNVRIVGKNLSLHQEKAHFEETWGPGHKVELGWLEGWRIEPGVELTISADGYAPKTWDW